MNYKDKIKDLFSVLKLEEAGLKKVSQDKFATIAGIVILMFPPVVNVLLALNTFPSGFGVMFQKFMMWPMFIPVFSIICVIFLMSFVANKFFNGIKDYIGFFRTISYSSAVLFVTIIPFILALFDVVDPIGFFNLIWIISACEMFLVSYKMLLIHHKLSKQDATYVIIVGVIGYFIVRNMLGEFLVGDVYRFWY